MKMRIAIREQLAAVVILAVGVALAIVSIPTWIFVNGFVVDVSSDGLSLTASLKAARISSEINLIQTACQTISTRLLIQEAFNKFYENEIRNVSVENPWKAAQADLESALGSAGFSGLLQARLYSRNTTGNPKGLLNITGVGATESGPILLPYKAPDGSPVYLGDPSEYGFPPALYPNITYIDLKRPSDAVSNTNAFSANVFPGVSLGNGSEKTGVLLGPLVVNSTFALISLTIPVREIKNNNFILGYMTLVANTKTLVEVQNSDEGMGRSGIVLFIGSTNPWNHFAPVAASNATYTPPLPEFEQQEVRFLLPPDPANSGQADRHSQRSFGSGRYSNPFQLRQYPSVLQVLSSQISEPNNATSDLSTTNEQGYAVAVGVARPQTPLVSWAIVVEQDEDEAYEPIETLRKILLGCVFGTLGLILLLVFPFAHWSVMPIRRLKEATEASGLPPGYEDDEDDIFDEENPSSGGAASGRLSEKGVLGRIRREIRKARRAKQRQGMTIEPGRQQFKIPAKVKDRKHFVTDELTELTHTFNAMTEELLKQYTSLDQKVAERTRELEISKKAAEAANESKTLFIANISHELKTPLNGIMGMCAVCMEEEDDLQRIKQSLKTVYKSGDLLLHLLEDLLSFSKNQIGQQVSLEEREFRLGDVRSQILAIFDKQVRESKIGFTATFVSSSESVDASPSPDMRTSMDRRLPALGPPGVGRLKDMCVWGDQHRILQVLINLVSNSLKFTPAGGKVNLRIRCVGEVEQPSDESRSSSFSRAGSNRVGRTRHRVGSGSANSTSSRSGHTSIPPVKGGTALSINPMDPKATPHIQVRERSPTPPPPNGKTYLFEFEVEDTGPGIPEHMQQKIFEPFVQGDLGLSKKYGGTGLGLSICSQLATLMGGNISLKSTLGVGTTFTMQIPLKYVKDR
jgi:osomolarity two-component system sensor histidine kinase SLN1